MPNFSAIAEVLGTREKNISDKKVNRDDGEKRNEIFGLKEDGIDYS